MRRTLAALILLALTSCAGPSVEWRLDHDTAVEEAQRDNRTMLVFFRAGWDVSAVEIERMFTKPRVVRELNRLVTVRVDMTLANPEGDALLESYEQPGVPSVVLVCPDGSHAAEFHQELPAAEMVDTLRTARRACRGRATPPGRIN